MTSTPDSIRIENVSKAFDQDWVLRDVSLELKPGEITAIVGGSGAGKTTLLRLIAGMETPDQGSILQGTQTLSSATNLIPPEKRRIGLIFQDFALFPHLNVEKNIGFGLFALPESKRQNIVEGWLQRMSLLERRTAYPHELSGGEQQRAAIARALAPNPVALLMDEPFSGLDPALRSSIRTTALDTVRSAGIPNLLVTHDPSEALSEADTIAIMQSGQIIQTGTPETLYRKPTSMAAAQALGSVSTLPKTSAPEEWQKFATGSVLAIRPEAVRLDTSSNTRLSVKKASRSGAMMIVEFDINGMSLIAHMLLRERPKAGIMMPVRLDETLVLTQLDTV